MINGRVLSKFWRRASQNRESTDEPIETEVPLYPAGSLSSLLWDLSHGLAVLAGVIVVAALVIAAFGRSWHLTEAFDTIIPDRWFRSLGESKAAERLEEIRKEAAQELRKRDAASKASAARPKTFGLGSTKEEVRVAQGKPDQAGNATWRYGDSEVYFVGDRVVGWRVSGSTPLKAR